MGTDRQKLVYELAEQLRRLSRVKWFLGNSDLELEGFMILDHLLEYDQSVMSDIVSSFSLAASTATGIVDRLTEKGFVVRRHSSEDRRKVILQITTNGKKAYSNFRKTALVRMDESLNHFSTNEIQDLINLVKSLIERLS